MVGLKPTAPQNVDGRTIEPPVWVPSEMGVLKSATAAAEPAEEAPGVRDGSCGLRAGPGSMMECRDTVFLPSSTTPSSRIRRVTAASSAGRRPGEDLRIAQLGRHVGGIDDVLQPQRHAVQALAPPFAVHQAGTLERLVRVDINPGLDDGIARRDALQARLGPLLAAQFARLHFTQPLLDRQRGDAGGGRPALGRLGHSTFFRHRNHSLGRKASFTSLGWKRRTGLCTGPPFLGSAKGLGRIGKHDAAGIEDVAPGR